MWGRMSSDARGARPRPGGAVSSPTARALEWLRRCGWLADVAERNVVTPERTFKRDLFGGIDLGAVRRGEVLFAQVTSRGNVSARVAKLRSLPATPILLGAGLVWVIGFGDGPTPRVVQLQPGDVEP